MSSMRVDQVIQTAAVSYSKSRIQRAQVTSESKFRDYLSLSGAGKDIGIARQALTKVPDVREDLVTDIRDRMTAGTYNVSDDDVADKIVGAYFGMAF